MAVRMQTPQEPPAERAKRTDNWWSAPLGFFLLFTTFVIWATFRAFQNDHYEIGNYLSPFYAPTIKLSWKIMGFSISPALVILPFPLSFRMTCYYYRKALYRSYAADPLACAVREPAPLFKMRLGKYTGERIFPLVIMNFHRYAFYAAAVFVVFLWYDTFRAFLFTDANGATHFGLGLGSLIFLANVSLISAYTFSCHSWRHLIGGGQDCYSCSLANKTRYGLWAKVSFLNERHGNWAMMSLVSVMLTDVYVFLLSQHIITDFRLF